MADRAPGMQDEQTRRMIDLFLSLSNGNLQFPQSNGAGAQAQDKKPKKKNQPNKKLEALKKKAADERAKHLKTVQELKELKIQTSIENKKKLIEKRKSMLEKEQERLKTLMEKNK